MEVSILPKTAHGPLGKGTFPPIMNVITAKKEKKKRKRKRVNREIRVDSVETPAIRAA